MKKKVQHRRPTRISEARKLEELKAFIQLCFAFLEAAGLDDKQIANATGRCLQTIRRLRAETFTLDIRYRTIEALGAAAGLKVEVGTASVEFKIVKPQRRKAA